MYKKCQVFIGYKSFECYILFFTQYTINKLNCIVTYNLKAIFTLFVMYVPHPLCLLLKAYHPHYHCPRIPGPSPQLGLETSRSMLCSLHPSALHHKWQWLHWGSWQRASNADQQPGNQSHKLLLYCHIKYSAVLFSASQHQLASPDQKFKRKVLFKAQFSMLLHNLFLLSYNKDVGYKNNLNCS